MATAKTKKLLTAGSAAAAALAIALTGTFAWQSISQQAKNEMSEKYANPGGRLHDDFDGYNKDVYVENFVDPADPDGVPIYARIRLDEYMEIGAGAGLPDGTEGKAAAPLVEGALFGDVATWKTHIPEEGNPAGSSSAFRQYFTWEMGGKTVYMPTFNKNRDSLTADINGTYAGPDGDPSTVQDRYKDYVEYVLGNTQAGSAVYDADENDVDEGDSAQENVNYTVKDETHTAAETQESTVLTMAQWKAAGSPVGPYWVYDVDGWAYWAQPINPGETTGLLLDRIVRNPPQNSWYYGINVVGQFSDGGDWGKGNQDGFYDEEAGTPPSEDALRLLNQAAGQTEGTLTITAEGGLKETFAGNSLQFRAEGAEAVEWSVSGQSSADTAIDAAGLLTIGADEAADTVLTVTATAPAAFSAAPAAASVSYTVTIRALWNQGLAALTPGSTDTVNIDGLDWYVLAREGNKALVFAKYAQDKMPFDDDSNIWEGSTTQAYLNGEWLDGMTELKAHAAETTLKTRRHYQSEEYITSTDRVFLLTEADAYGTQNKDADIVRDEDYTLGKPGILLPEEIRWMNRLDADGEETVYGDYWLRNPCCADTYVAAVEAKNKEPKYWEYTTECRIRPALWLELI